MLLIALTFIIYLASQALQRRFNIALFNPVLLTIVVLIVILSVTDTPYEDYRMGGQYIEFWLKPAVVALGVPLYRQLRTIRRQLLPIMLAEVVGCVVGIVSVAVTARLFGATQEVIVSLVPKAVTTPIAIEISQAIGGIPPLTAAVVVCTGILGNMAGFRIARMTRVNRPISSSLSVGTASHAVGTAAAIKVSQRWGAYASLGLILNGLLTALLAPLLLPLIM